MSEVLPLESLSKSKRLSIALQAQYAVLALQAEAAKTELAAMTEQNKVLAQENAQLYVQFKQLESSL